MEATTRVTSERLSAGHVSEYALNEVRVWPSRTGSIGVVRTNQGFFAMRNRCPHQAAPICAGKVMGAMRPSAPHEYRYDDDVPIIRCPAHRWEFRLDNGRSIGGITKKRIVTYEVEVDGDAVYIMVRKGAAR